MYSVYYMEIVIRLYLTECQCIFYIFFSPYYDINNHLLTL